METAECVIFKFNLLSRKNFSFHRITAHIWFGILARPAKLSAKNASPIFAAGKTPDGVILYQPQTSDMRGRCTPLALSMSYEILAFIRSPKEWEEAFSV